MQIPLLEPEPFEPLPIDATRYVAALHAYPGERDALRHVSPATWKQMTPLIHVVGPKTPPERFRAETVRGWMKRIGRSVGVHPIYIDVARLNPMHSTINGDGLQPVLECMFEASRRIGLRFMPVTWVGESSDKHRRIVQDAALLDGHGLALRYRMRQFLPPPGTSIRDLVSAELGALGREAGEVDLILDLEYIDLDDELEPDGLAATIKPLLAVGPWRAVVLLGSSIPSVMSCIDEGTVDSLPRKEWELWTELQERDLDRMPAFGDYGIQNPHPPHDGGGPGMRANIRYTANGKTLIARGAGPFYEEGNAQYKDLCEKLVTRREFAGRDFSWGDCVIDDCAQGAVEPGDQRVWRGAGTSHHLRTVIEQLSSAQSPS
jgi:hypothetical protein